MIHGFPLPEVDEIPFDVGLLNNTEIGITQPGITSKYEQVSYTLTFLLI
jgi:hypothetical protein